MSLTPTPLRASGAYLALSEVMDNIKVDEDKRAEEVAIIEKFVKDRLLQEMKDSDALFKALFKEIQHVGSSYEKLRLDETSDFDFNLVLDLDILDNIIQLDFSTVGFAELVVRWRDMRIPGNHPLYR